MRRAVIIVAVTVLAGVSATATATAAHASHKASPKCPPAHEEVIAADPQAVIYKTPESEERLLNISACAYSHRPYVLGRKAAFGPGGGGGIQDETLAGPIVAYEESHLFEGGRDEYVIVVRDLRIGRVIHKVPTAETRFPGDVGNGGATDLVVKSDGAIAWIVETANEPTTTEVHAIDRTGSRLLASGAAIDPHSLALAGSTLYWTQGGKPASDVLN